MLNEILDFIVEVWERLKKIFRAIFNFFNDLKNWFVSKIKTVIQRHPKVKPISLRIKKALETGKYSTLDIGLSREEAIVNTFYDTETEEILEEYTEVVETNQLDSETIKAFGDEDILILS